MYASDPAGAQAASGQGMAGFARRQDFYQGGEHAVPADAGPLPADAHVTGVSAHPLLPGGGQPRTPAGQPEGGQFAAATQQPYMPEQPGEPPEAPEPPEYGGVT